MSRAAVPVAGGAAERLRAAAATCAFLCITGIFAARGILGETFQRVELSYLSSRIAELGPTPGITALLDTLLLLAAAVLLLVESRVRPPRALVQGGLCLAGAAALSIWAAHDQRVALNATGNLLATVLAGAAAALACRRPGRAALLLAALIASTSTNALKCLTQQAFEFDDSLQYWQEQKQALAARGVDLNSPDLVNYERRLQSRESFGHLAHANVTADCMSAGLVLSIAACVVAGTARPARRERLPLAIVAAAGAFVLAWGVRTTGSTAGYVGIGAGLACLAFAMAHWQRLARQPAAALLLLGIPYGGLVLLGLGYGAVAGSLPGASLAFRWEYWRAAGLALLEHPWTGLGRENFLAAFLRFKPAWLTEEARDPHNIWVTLLVELGPLGLIGAALLIIAALRRLICVAGPRDQGAVTESRVADGAPGRAPAPARGLAPIATRVGVIVAVALVHGLASREPTDPASGLVWAVQPMLVWSIAFVAGVLVLERLEQLGVAPNWRNAAILAAGAAMLVEGLVSFALITTSGLSLFVGMLAAAQGGPASPPAADDAAGRSPRRSEPSSAPRSGRTGASHSERTARGAVRWFGAAAIVLALVQLTLVAAPAVSVERRLADLRAALRRPMDSYAILAARQHTEALQAADPWDAEAMRSAADGWLRAALTPGLNDATRLTFCEAARRAAEEAHRRNPYSTAAVRTLSQVFEMQTAVEEHRGNAEAAREANERSVVALRIGRGLYPTDPLLRIRLGLVLYRKWRHTGADEAGREALAEFEAAQGIDALRPPGNASKLPEDVWVEVRSAQTALKAAGLTAPSTSPG